MKQHTIQAVPSIVFFGLSCLLSAPPVAADNGSSTCANLLVVNETGDNTCYTVTPPPPGGAITVDGQESPVSEWNGSEPKDLGGDFTGVAEMFRDGNDLYFLITVNDSTFSTNDQIGLYVDPLHNHGSAGEDVIFRIKRDSSGSADHRKVIGGADSAWNPSVLGSELAVMGDSVAALSWTAEVKLTAAELDLSDLPPIVGFGVQAEDSGTGNLSTWPLNFDSTNPATSWANLKNRYPIDFMIVIDQSGSMLSQSKWDNAKKAANFLVNTMSVFRDPTYFVDRIGSVTFSWLCAGSNQTETPDGKGLSQVGPFPVGNYTDAAPALTPPESNFCTPIGEGLEEAFRVTNLDANQSTGDAEKQRGVLLLSDGLQNRPNSTFLPADTGYQGCSNNWNACSESNVEVNTVAFGEGDWAVDTDLLTDIKNHYAGATDSNFNLTPNIEDLKQAFISSLENFFLLNLASAGAPGNFTVDDGEHKLAVILSWTTPGNAQSFIVQRQNQDLSWSTVSCDQAGTESSTVGFAICVVNHPQGGTWRAVKDAIPNPFTQDPDRQFVLVDLKLRARFGIDRVIHGTGNDIVLTAELKDGGLPLTHDPASHPVHVTVKIEEPEEGFGTFTSTHSPQTCEELEPQLPLPPHDPVIFGTTPSSTMIMSGPSPSASAPVPGTGDPPQQRFSTIASLLDACGKDGLLRDEEPGLELRDDGSQGDEVADDGIYTLRFTNTQYEGSYRFTFLAEGENLDGSAFTRTKVFAEYVRVEVDPAATESGSRVLQQSGATVFREYYVLPRDRFGGYLGLGHAADVQFLASAGTWIGPVIDYGNGYYARTLSYDASQGEPDVTPVVQDKPIGLRGRGFELVVPYVGYTYFDSAIGLDDGPVIGARLGYRFTEHLVLELEGGATFTDTALGDKGIVIQAMGNLRYYFGPPQTGQWDPYATAGVGVFLFRGFGADDEALATQAGFGAIYRHTKSFGLQLEGRVFYLEDVVGAGTTTNTQATVGLVFNLD